MTCAPSIRDLSNPSNCIAASSIPVLGTLLPLGPYFYVDPTGAVGIGTTTPAALLDVAGDMTAGGRVALGNDAAFGAQNDWDRAFDLSYRTTDFSSASNWAGLRSWLTVDSAVDLTGVNERYVYSGDLVAEVDSSNASNYAWVQAPNLWAIHSGSGNVTALIGADSAAETRFGTADAVVGLAVQALADGVGQNGWSCGVEIIGGAETASASVSTNCGLLLGTPIAQGAIGDNYGLYLLDQTVASGDNYAIYSEGGTSYFAGAVGIGTDTPSAELEVVGDFAATGTKSFVQSHPTDPTKEVWFACLEGNEAGTYFRGTASLSGGVARIFVPEDFRAVTEAAGLSVQLTAYGPGADLYVDWVDLTTLTVRGMRDVEFAYVVNGVRRGQAGFQTIRDRDVRRSRASMGTVPSDAGRRGIASDRAQR